MAVDVETYNDQASGVEMVPRARVRFAEEDEYFAQDSCGNARGGSSMFAAWSCKMKIAIITVLVVIAAYLTYSKCMSNCVAVEGSAEMQQQRKDSRKWALVASGCVIFVSGYFMFVRRCPQ
jgi:hypothetical protein